VKGRKKAEIKGISVENMLPNDVRMITHKLRFVKHIGE
jgi:hypothetical protein